MRVRYSASAARGGMALDGWPRRYGRDEVEAVVPGEGMPSPDPVGDLLQLLAKLPDDDAQNARDLLAEIVDLTPEQQTGGQAQDSAMRISGDEAIARRFPHFSRLKFTY